MDTPVPETFDDLSDEQIAELIDKLTTEFDEAYDAETPTPVAELTEIADALDAVRAEQTSRTEQSAADDETRQALADRVRPDSDETDETDAADAADAETETAETETDESDETESADAETDDRELITASGQRRTTRPASAAAVARRSKAPAAPPSESPELVITASADVPGFGNGQKIDRSGIASGLHARARGLGDSKGRNTRYNVATVNVPIPDEFRINEATTDPWDVIDSAVRSELAGKDAAALVASGGWCAPSEPIYDTFNVVSADGLVDLPTVGASRGGVSYPDYVGLSAVSSGLWTWSEDNDITPGSDGDATKGCIEIPCPTFSECRLGAEGLCVTHGNLMDRAYPEFTRYFVDLVMTAHLHRLSNAKVAAIVASADAVTVTTISDAAGDILGAIDLQVADYRSEHLLSENVVLDGMFPQWFIEAIRTSITARTGIDAGFDMTAAMVRSFLTARNVRPQFLAGYEPLFDTNPATAFPATGKFLLAVAGGYAVADGGEIDLGVVRDSTLNATNDFTAAWSEQFFCVIQRGPAAREVTVPTVTDGVTACCPVV